MTGIEQLNLLYNKSTEISVFSILEFLAKRKFKEINIDFISDLINVNFEKEDQEISTKNMNYFSFFTELLSINLNFEKIISLKSTLICVDNLFTSLHEFEEFDMIDYKM